METRHFLQCLCWRTSEYSIYLTIELLPLIEVGLQSEKHPSIWCAALMDYGAYIKTQTANPSRKSAHHTKQKKFKGSEREVRGALLRSLTQSKAHFFFFNAFF